jgi:hypothetical protein
MNKFAYPIAYRTEISQVAREAYKTRIRNLEYASRQKIRHLPQLEEHSGVCAIVGAAPSVKDHLDQIREIKKGEINIVMSINGAHDFLVKNNIIPNIHVLFEIDLIAPEESLGGPVNRYVTYYICSHCKPELFRRTRGQYRVLWHCHDDEPDYQAVIARLFPGEFMVAGGYVTFFRSLVIANILGYRKFELFGCDASCEATGESHLENYHTKHNEPLMDVWAGTKERNRIFRTIPSLSFQAYEFMRFCEAHQHRLSIRVHGDGLMRFMHETDFPEQYLDTPTSAGINEK